MPRRNAKLSHQRLRWALVMAMARAASLAGCCSESTVRDDFETPLFPEAIWMLMLEAGFRYHL